MTTKEFIERVEKLGYFVEFCGSDIEVNYGGLKIAEVNAKEFMCLETNYYGWKHRGDAELFDIIVEYAKTPIAERDEVYYLMANDYFDHGNNFLNLLRSTKSYALGSKGETDVFQTRFTEAEISQMPKWCQALERVEWKR